MKYILIDKCDEELYQFYLNQKTYFSLLSEDVTYDFICEDMKGPEGFDERLHFHYKIFDRDIMIGYLDYILGYRFPMTHDSFCIWISMFFVDENHWHQHYGTQIIQRLCREYVDYTIQLGCLSQNINGCDFWKAMGFKEIARSYCGHEEVIIFEK